MEAGYTCSFAPDSSYGISENIHNRSSVISSAQDFVRDWMNSPGHRANILDDKNDIIGVGVFHGYATQNFALCNRLPTATGSIPDQDLTIDGSVTVDLSSHFTDPDDDNLTYTASSSDPGKATVSVRGSTLTVTGVAEAAVIILVSASDCPQDSEDVSAVNPSLALSTNVLSGGSEGVVCGSPRLSFAVTVQKNRPPAVTGSIPDQDLTIDGSVTVDLSSYFTDPDDDNLTYTASSSDPGKATVSVSGSTLTITGVAEEAATIMVSASDGKDDGSASNSFTVTVKKVGLEISERTIRIDDPLNQVDFAVLLKQVSAVATGQIFKDKAKEETSRVERLIDGVEQVVETIEFVLDSASLASAATDLLASGQVRTLLQNELDGIIGTEEYTVQLSAKPEESVTVSIASDEPAAFVITPQTLTFTPDNYNSPQTVRVRPAFTVANYVDGTVPDLSTLSHTVSSGIAAAEVRIGVIGSQPIRDRLNSALVEVLEGIDVFTLFCVATPQTCTVFNLGQRIGNLINELIEDTVVRDALDNVAEALGTAHGTVKTIYQQGGMAALVEHVSEQFSSSGSDPAPSVASQPRAAVQSRIGARPSAGTGGGSDLSLLDQVVERSADFLVTHHQELNAGHFEAHHALALLGTDFNLPLSSLGIAQQDGATDDTTSAARNFALWGSVDYSQFGDRADNFSTDGRNWTFTVGVDGHLKPDLLAGVALSRSTARSDYDYFGSAMGGDYDVDLTVISPYLNWSASDSLGLWASVGYGKGSSRFSLNTIGDLELSAIEELDQAATRQERDSDFFSFAAGLRWDAFHSDATQLALKLAGSTTSFLATESQQGRLAAEVSREFPFTSGVLSSSLDLALLLDSDNPSAMEVVGGLDWAAANDRFTASTAARSLLFSGDRYEWGLGAALNYQAGVRPGEGLSLSLTPSFGVTDPDLTDLDILSTPEETDLAFHQWQPSARFNAQLGYGIPTGKALLTPYTQLNMTHHSTVYGAGLRYALDDSLDLDLSASHRQRPSGSNDNRLFLRLRTDL